MRFVAAAIDKPEDQAGIDYPDGTPGGFYMGGIALLEEREKEALKFDLWLASDWERQSGAFLPQERWDYWEAELARDDEVNQGVDEDVWVNGRPRTGGDTCEKFIDLLIDVAKRVRGRLEAEGVIDGDFLVVAADFTTDIEDILMASLPPGEEASWGRAR
ncbi:MAG: hypothetical protein LBC97_12775 [Bifidobacteriaceae bacterium]|nr:hypothetical protein [Bifidobacteriaceae bacterium]